MEVIVAKATFACWIIALVSFFGWFFLAAMWETPDGNLLRKVETWGDLFRSISGEYGFRLMVFGIVYFVSLVSSISAMGLFFLCGIFARS